MNSTRDPHENPESPFSYGTGPLLDGLAKLIPSNKYDTIVVNLGTLMRNIMELTGGHVAKTNNAVFTELKFVVDDIVAMFGKSKVKQPAIIFYVADPYQSINKDYQRDMTDKRRDYRNCLGGLFKGEEILKSILGIDANGVGRREGVLIKLDLIKSSSPAYVNLVNSVRTMPNLNKVVLVSHVPLDFHLMFQCRNSVLCESHKGTVVHLDRLNYKVWRKDEVPFTKDTHAIFGDKDFIRRNIGIKEYRRMKEIAADEKWNRATPQRVRERLKKHNFEIPFNLR